MTTLSNLSGMPTYVIVSCDGEEVPYVFHAGHFYLFRDVAISITSGLLGGNPVIGWCRNVDLATFLSTADPTVHPVDRYTFRTLAKKRKLHAF